MLENARFRPIPQAYAKALVCDEREAGHFQPLSPLGPGRAKVENASFLTLLRSCVYLNELSTFQLNIKDFKEDVNGTGGLQCILCDRVLLDLSQKSPYTALNIHSLCNYFFSAQENDKLLPGGRPSK